MKGSNSIFNYLKTKARHLLNIKFMTLLQHVITAVRPLYHKYYVVLRIEFNKNR